MKRISTTALYIHVNWVVFPFTEMHACMLVILLFNLKNLEEVRKECMVFIVASPATRGMYVSAE